MGQQCEKMSLVLVFIVQFPCSFTECMQNFTLHRNDVLRRGLGVAVTFFMRYHITALLTGANDFSVLSSFFLSFLLSNLFLPHPSSSSSFWLLPVLSPRVIFLCSSSLVLPTAYWTARPRCPKLSLSEAELTCLWEWRASPSVQALSSPCLDPCSDCWLQVWSEFPNLVFKVLHVPAGVLLFSMSPLYLGPRLLPQTPYIFTLLFSALAIPSVWSVLSLSFEMQNPVQILLLLWSFPLFCFLFKNLFLVKSNQSYLFYQFFISASIIAWCSNYPFAAFL